MPASTICRLQRVIHMTGLSRSAIYALMADGQFPTQVNLGPRTVGWVESEVFDWIETRIAARAHGSSGDPTTHRSAAT